MKLGFQDIFKLPSRVEAELSLTDCISLVQASAIPQMKRLAKSIKRHWSGILNWFDINISNGQVELLEPLTQSSKEPKI